MYAASCAVPLHHTLVVRRVSVPFRRMRVQIKKTKRKEKKWRAERDDAKKEEKRNADVYDMAIIPLPNNIHTYILPRIARQCVLSMDFHFA